MSIKAEAFFPFESYPSLGQKKMTTDTTSARTDIFPARIDESASVRRLPDRPDFPAIASTFKIYPFIIYLGQSDTVYYKPVEWNGRYQKHFSDTGGYVKTLGSYEEKPWCWAARKLRKDVQDNLRKNVDPRTCFKYEYNYFLVKSCFTTGQRTVQPGTKHVYQIGAVQMIFYFANSLFGHRLQKRERLFPVDEQYLYTRRILRPGQCYVVPENTVYVLYATNKCFFSVHILRSDEEPSFPCRDPMREATKRSSSVDLLYRRPVKTPLIEDAVLDGREPSCESLYDQPSTSAAADRVLMTMASGQEVTDGMLMPPPSHAPTAVPAPPQTFHHQIITVVPIDKTVRVVAPETVSWHQHHFKFKEYPDPKEPVWELGWSDQTEPLNLSATTPDRETDAVATTPETDVAATTPESDAAATTPETYAATTPETYAATTPETYAATLPDHETYAATPPETYPATTSETYAAIPPDHETYATTAEDCTIDENDFNLEEIMKTYESVESDNAVIELFNSFINGF